MGVDSGDGWNWLIPECAALADGAIGASVDATGGDQEIYTVHHHVVCVKAMTDVREMRQGLRPTYEHFLEKGIHVSFQGR